MLTPQGYDSSENLQVNSSANYKESNNLPASSKVPSLTKKHKGRKSKIKEDNNNNHLEKVRQAYLSPAISKALTERNEIRKKKLEEIKRFGEELDLLGRQRAIVKEQERKVFTQETNSKTVEKGDSGGRDASGVHGKSKEKFYLPTLNQMSSLSTATFSNKNTFDFSSTSPKKHLSMLSSLEMITSKYSHNRK